MDKLFDEVKNKRDYFPPLMAVGGGIYLTENFVLQIACRNFVSGLVLSIKGSILTKKGSLQPIRIDNFIPTSDGAESLATLTLKEGLLVSCQVYIIGTTSLVREGDCYVSLNLISERGDTPSVPLVATLAGGYVTNSKGVSYPLSGVHDMTSVNGKSTIETQANPVAGSEWIYTIPNHRRFKVQHISFEITTSAVAGNRNIFINVSENGGANGLYFISSTNIPASNVGFYSYFDKVGTERVVVSGTNNFVNVPFSEIELHAGDTIRSSSFNLGVADQFARVRLYGNICIDVGTSAGSPAGGGGAQ